MGNIFHEDFQDFIVALNQNEVEYIIVGGYSVILHGYSRTTGDLDVWVNKTAVDDDADFITDYYTADATSAQNYYPFGMTMPDRKFNDGTYKFGFNGMEMDNEVSGNGNSYDYGFRIYNPRLGKFLSVDPLTLDYPAYTPYQFAGNKPIWALDIDGLEDYTFIWRMKDDKKVLIRYIDHEKTEGGPGPLGHGSYGQIISENGEEFAEAFIPKKGNPIPKFAEAGIDRANFENLDIRLNARLIEKVVEISLIDQGFDPKSVEEDIQVLDSPDSRYLGKFATFKDDTEDTYIEEWTEVDVSKNHESNTGAVSKEIGETGLLIKYYDGKVDPNDDAPNQIGFVQQDDVAHAWEFIKATVDAFLGTDAVNLGAENATTIVDAAPRVETDDLKEKVDTDDKN